MSQGCEPSTSPLAGVITVFELWEQKCAQLYLDVTALETFIKRNGFDFGKILEEGRTDPAVNNEASERLKAWSEPIQEAQRSSLFMAYREAFSPERTN